MKQNESKGISNIGINFSYYLAERREKEEGEKQNVKEKYASLKEESAIINIKFDFSNADGDLLLYEDDWKIVLRNEEILGRNYEPKKRMAMLLRSHAVKILEINEPEKCIFVSCADVRNKDRDRLREILDSKRDGIVKVPAKVVYVYPNMLILDIGGLGIPGFLKIADWSLAYTISLQTVVKRGDVFEIEVLKNILRHPQRQKNILAAGWISRLTNVPERRLWNMIRGRVLKSGFTKGILSRFSARANIP